MKAVSNIDSTISSEKKSNITPDNNEKPIVSIPLIIGNIKDVTLCGCEDYECGCSGDCGCDGDDVRP